MLSDLISIYEKLQIPVRASSDIEEFFTECIENCEGWYIGKSCENTPVLIVKANGPNYLRNLPYIQLENLRVSHGVLCDMRFDDKNVIRDEYSIIECLSAESDLQVCFLTIVEGISTCLRGDWKVEDLEALIVNLVNLFRIVRKPRNKSIAGLWGELFTIIESPNSEAMINACHTDVSERYDFSSGHCHLEVKATSSSVRSHVFKLEQTNPPSGSRIFICSLLLNKRNNGLTLGELWDSVRKATSDPSLKMKIERVCMEALGNEIATARGVGFDYNFAKEHIAFFNAEDVPCPSPDLPNGVSEVSFRSDLTFSKQVAGGDDSVFLEFFAK